MRAGCTASQSLVCESERGTRTCSDLATPLTRLIVRAATGKLYAWGSGLNHQLGIGDNRTQLSPCAIEGFDSGVVAIGTGLYHSVAVTQSNRLYIWGTNQAMQLGDLVQRRRYGSLFVRHACGGLNVLLTVRALEHWPYRKPCQHRKSSNPTSTSCRLLVA